MKTCLVALFILAGCWGISVGIDPSCYNPSGADCKWYATCMEKKNPCPQNNYAMQYASYFCKKFGENYQSFTATGQRWVDRTRKCLQTVLVPFLDNFTTCPKLKQKAFDTHTCCYLAGKECTALSETNAVSICDLPLSDWLKVFWTIKDAFNVFSQNSDVINSLKGGLSVLKGCGTNILGDEFMAENFVEQEKQNSPVLEGADFSDFMNGILNEEDLLMKWESKIKK